MQPVQVPLVGRVGSVGVGFPDGFGEVLGEVADRLVGVVGDDALQIKLRAEPHQMRRPGIRVSVDPVERLGLVTRRSATLLPRLVLRRSRRAFNCQPTRLFDLAGRPVRSQRLSAVGLLCR